MFLTTLERKWSRIWPRSKSLWLCETSRSRSYRNY